MDCFGWVVDGFGVWWMAKLDRLLILVARVGVAPVSPSRANERAVLVPTFQARSSWTTDDGGSLGSRQLNEMTRNRPTLAWA